MIRQHSPYDLVADEYYDPILHPTCANFRSLSKRFISILSSEVEFSDLVKGPIIETGCGKSLLCEMADEGVFEFSDNTVVQDHSEKMISHSIRWQNLLADIFISDARNMPVSNDSFAKAFSFLADPYNDRGLWREISRILAPRGYWIVTVPAHDWAIRFREKSGLEVSRFVTANGSEYDLPSYTYAPHELISGARGFGLSLRQFKSFKTSQIEGSVSGKLFVGDHETAVLDCYIFQLEA